MYDFDNIINNVVSYTEEMKYMAQSYRNFKSIVYIALTIILFIVILIIAKQHDIVEEIKRQNDKLEEIMEKLQDTGPKE